MHTYVHVKPTRKHRKIQISKQTKHERKKAKQLKGTEITSKILKIQIKSPNSILRMNIFILNIAMLVASSSAGNTNKYKKNKISLECTL